MALILEIVACAAAIALTPPVVWFTMQRWHDRKHGKRQTVTAPAMHEVQNAVDTALARSARTYRVAERCDPRA